MARGFFVTGTDTNVGKTTCALGLMRAFKDAGFTVAAMKPVSAGCERTPKGLRNEDALLLMQEASVKHAYETVNPYAFEPPVAPHIAAADANVEINIDIITKSYKTISDQADIVIVEGAGGWLVPINDKETMADVAKALNLDVITIVGIRLGCLNHAMLTSESICSHTLNHIGWIANQLSKNMCSAAENIQTLKQRLETTLLGQVPFDPAASSDSITKNISIDCLLK